MHSLLLVLMLQSAILFDPDQQLAFTSVENTGRYELVADGGVPITIINPAPLVGTPGDVTAQMPLLAPNLSHTLKLSACNAAGCASATVLNIPAVPLADSTPPVIASVQNSAGVIVTTGSVRLGNPPYRLDVAVSDNIGVSSVTLTMDGFIVGTAGPLADYLRPIVYFYLNHRSFTVGPHAFVLTAKDAAGNVATRSWVMTR